MNPVTLSVASREDVTRRALAALKGQKQGAHISFASAELLWKTLTRKRWGLLHAMTGQGAMSIREAARRVGRDVKAVHGDIQALIMPASSTERRRASNFPMMRSTSSSC